MDHFRWQDDALYAEDVPLATIAQDVGTPCYVYSRATLERHWKAFDDALAGLDHLGLLRHKGTAQPRGFESFCSLRLGV